MKTLSDTPIDLDLQQEDDSADTFKVYSEVMRNLYKKIPELALEKRNIVFFGELGTGKQYLANLIHSLSTFASGEFQNIYCNSLEELLGQSANGIEEQHDTQTYRFLSELGIDVRSGGTLFFNSFSELNHQNQMKMMKLLRKAQIWATSQENISNFRIIISIVPSPFTESTELISREVLIDYFDPEIVHIPPLRDRCEDITLLIDQFLIEYARKNDSSVHAISYRATYKCISYYWPGNVRQLKNTIEHAATIVPPGSVITNDQLPFSIEWKSPTTHINVNMEQNESFKRAEKLLLNELAARSNLTNQELQKIEYEFRLHYKNE